MGILSTLLDDNGETSSEIGGLLTDLGTLVIKTPENGGDDLGEVRFDSNACERKMNGGRA